MVTVVTVLKLFVKLHNIFHYNKYPITLHALTLMKTQVLEMILLYIFLYMYTIFSMDVLWGMQY